MKCNYILSVSILRKLKSTRVLCLPENFENAKTIDELEHTSDSDELYKLLKNEGIKCANSRDLGCDLGIDKRYKVRKSLDLYPGALLILAPVVIDKIIDVVTYMVRKRKEEAFEPNLQINIKNCNIIFLEGGNLKVENFEGDLEDFKRDLTAVGRRMDKI